MDEICDIAGAIRVVLHPDGGRVGRVTIHSTRPTHAARIFEGKTAAELTGTIGQIFSLCGIAQTVAALRACEAALGHVAALGAEAARDLARLAEMMTQTVMRLALHWPRALGRAPDPAPVRAALMLQQTIETEILGPAWRVPGGALDIKPGAAERVRQQLDALARTDLTGPLQAILAETGIEGFGALPAGLAPEAGALSRQWEAPEVAAARARHGAGLSARLAASAADLAGLPGLMRAALAALAPSPARSAPRETGQGAAVVETARGPLTLRVSIAGGRIETCETEAPTEANFTAEGPVAMGLIGGPLDLGAAELHVLAVDPCVACSVEQGAAI